MHSPMQGSIRTDSSSSRDSINRNSSIKDSPMGDSLSHRDSLNKDSFKRDSVFRDSPKSASSREHSPKSRLRPERSQSLIYGARDSRAKGTEDSVRRDSPRSLKSLDSGYEGGLRSLEDSDSGESQPGMIIKT
jgi:hypothetical protein